jgi:thiol-disulfide isomerase/thioredoxin
MTDADEPIVPFAPPPAIGVLVAVLSIGTAGWFATRAAGDACRGGERVAASLLDVELRSVVPTPLDLPTLDGKRIALASLTDKIVVVNFWATWCPPCVEEMPSVIRLQERFAKDPRFVLLAVSADESWEPVRKFFGDKPPPYPVLLDARGELARKYGTTMFPETYVVKGGRIVGFIEGPRRWDEWYAEAYLRELLERP